MFEDLRADINRNLKDYEPASALKRLALCLTHNSIHAVALIRFQFWCARHGVPTFFAAKLLFYIFKIEVSKKSKIGPGLRLPHPMNIIIAPNVIIGPKCDMYADVRVVLAGSKDGARIGENVFLGDGARVVGNISIGDNSVIGVGSVVTRDIPANCTAAGVPARVLKQNIQRTE